MLSKNAEPSPYREGAYRSQDDYTGAGEFIPWPGTKAKPDQLITGREFATALHATGIIPDDLYTQDSKIVIDPKGLTVLQTNIVLPLDKLTKVIEYLNASRQYDLSTRSRPPTEIERASATASDFGDPDIKP